MPCLCHSVAVRAWQVFTGQNLPHGEGSLLLHAERQAQEYNLLSKDAHSNSRENACSQVALNLLVNCLKTANLPYCVK